MRLSLRDAASAATVPASYKRAFSPRSSPPPASRAVPAQRTRPQSQPRANRRRYVVQLRAAIAAVVGGHRVGAQPVSAGLAFGIDALHGPAGHVLQAPPLFSNLVEPTSRAPKVDAILRPVTCGVKKEHTRYRGMFSTVPRGHRVPPDSRARRAPRFGLRRLRACGI